MIVNIEWFKLDQYGSVKVNMSYFDKTEADEFAAFINRHQHNFPENFFIKHTNIEKDLTVDQHILTPGSIPQFFMLSNNSYLNFTDIEVYKVMKIKLTDTDYNFVVNYDLNFNVVGKVLIYKEAKGDYFKKEIQKRYSFSKL